MIRRVLIANRGEIALRVIRACRERGLSTVAVYSEADAAAPYVAAADRAEAIGPAAATASYLNIDAIIRAARHAEADAIHPGYGFLSENAAFAKACEDARITFIGPPSPVIARAGSKIAARQLAQQAGVPVVPGATPVEQTDDALATAIASVGFPALLKAVSGGGGRGMRVVRSASDVADEVGAARREVQRAFGGSALFVERLVERPRHVEVQILADAHGGVVHLFERDCTLQRRYQKVVEEAPGPTLTPRTRERLTAAAVSVARAVGYVNAGTCEFLVHGAGDDAPFYFLEMNTRLQVEHPVTESITGIDLVQAQLAIADGEPLAFSQSDVTLSGHAIECRIYAEDSQHLLPQSGTLLRYREPSGAGIRVDSGTREGHAITVHYDPMIAKLITVGDDRPHTLARMRDALRAFEILGVRHNIAFLLALLERPEVASSTTHTRFIEEHLTELTRAPSNDVRHAAIAMAAYASLHTPLTAAASDEDGRSRDPWVALGPINW